MQEGRCFRSGERIVDTKVIEELKSRKISIVNMNGF